jgi:hypothetical protein
MRDEPNAHADQPNSPLTDPRKGVTEFRQQDGGHGSRNPLRSRVTTHLPNSVALKKDGAEAGVVGGVALSP